MTGFKTRSLFAMRKWQTLFFLLVFFSSNQMLTGQNHPQKSKSTTNLLAYTEQMYGNNDKLVCGGIYAPSHPNAHGNPYFPDLGFSLGGVWINGTFFENERLKFDIELDAMVLQKEISKNACVEILLNMDAVDYFSIGEAEFANAKHYPSFKSKSKFPEIIYQGSFTILASHHIVFEADYSPSRPNGKYAKPRRRLFLIRNGKAIAIRNKKALREAFPGKEKAIRKLFKQLKIKLKTTDKNNLNKFFKSIDETKDQTF
jgi:hypothetical protein